MIVCWPVRVVGWRGTWREWGGDNNSFLQAFLCEE